jgi:fatty acid desaturase
MLLNQYQDLRKRLSEEGAFRVRDLWGLATVLGEAAAFAACFAGLLASRPGSLPYWACELFLGIAVFRIFILLHECGHGSLFTSRAANTLVGSAASAVCLVPFWSWKNIHADHHQWVGVIDRDPTQAHLLGLRHCPGWQRWLFRFFWKSWLPVPMIKFLFDLFWGYPFRQLLRGERKNGWLGLASLGVCVGPHLLAVGWLGLPRYLVLVGPMLLVFYGLMELVNLPHHSGHFPYLSDGHPRPIPFREQAAVTRTTYLPRWLAVFLCYNFNLHTEHHLFPTVPWYNLSRVTEKVRGGQAGCRYEEVAFFRFIRELRRQDALEVYEKALPTPRAAQAPARVSGAAVAEVGR